MNGWEITLWQLRWSKPWHEVALRECSQKSVPGWAYELIQEMLIEVRVNFYFLAWEIDRAVEMMFYRGLNRIGSEKVFATSGEFTCTFVRCLPVHLNWFLLLRKLEGLTYRAIIFLEFKQSGLWMMLYSKYRGKKKKRQAGLVHNAS